MLCWLESNVLLQRKHASRWNFDKPQTALYSPCWCWVELITNNLLYNKRSQRVSSGLKKRGEFRGLKHYGRSTINQFKLCAAAWKTNPFTSLSLHDVIIVTVITQGHFENSPDQVLSSISLVRSRFILQQYTVWIIQSRCQMAFVLFFCPPAAVPALNSAHKDRL